MMIKSMEIQTLDQNLNNMPETSTDLHVRIAVLETVIIGLREAISLQASEYERRLNELNHAHAQATADRNKFINSDLFYSKLDEIVKWRSELDAWRGRVVGIALGIGAAAGVGGGLISTLIAKLVAK